MDFWKFAHNFLFGVLYYFNTPQIVNGYGAEYAQLFT